MHLISIQENLNYQRIFSIENRNLILFFNFKNNLQFQNIPIPNHLM